MDTVLTTEWGFLLFFIAMWVLATLVDLAGRRWLGKDLMKYLTGDSSCGCTGGCCTGNSRSAHSGNHSGT
ncbi:hypothetical protein [Rheinheimera sp. 4Y26]|uniref:hypothetical protein n=1 Tax=Rheinheimera sp. 4Y26 TaxID=2977811 RepID=UPI0021B144FD|nr:hypothetical protein [Rheinheimera sp. 4Y26]MCT6699984.1 hypothetical protein [Rheinheimera sp. 4Y26]